MTIRKGEPWGRLVTPPSDLPIFDHDREAGAWLQTIPTGDAVPAFGLRGGDMARTMGGGGEGRFQGEVVCAPVDLLVVVHDGVTRRALSHVVMRRSWWRGSVVLAMNAQFLGRYDVAPRSHPNDGRVDVLTVDARMSVRSRLQARRRAVSGTHVPHPHITAQSASMWSISFPRAMWCWVDGHRIGRVRSIEVQVLPDALRVHV